MRINGIFSYKLNLQSHKQENRAPLNRPACDCFVKSSAQPAFTGQTDKLKNGFLTNSSKPELNKIEKEMIKKLRDNGFDNKSIKDTLTDICHWNDYFAKQEDKEFLLKNCLKNFDLLIKGAEQDPVQIKKRLRDRSLVCTNYAGDLNTRAFDVFNQLLEGSKSYRIPYIILNSIQHNSNYGEIRDSDLDDVLLLVKNGVPYETIHNALGICRDECWNINENNINTFKDFVSGIPELSYVDTSTLRQCKNSEGILNPKACKLYKEIRKKYYNNEDETLCSHIASSCIEYGKCNQKLFKLIKQLEQSLNKNPMISGDGAFHDIIVGTDDSDAIVYLNTKFLEDFLNYAKIKNLNPHDYYKTMLICQDNAQNFDPDRLDSLSKLKQAAIERRDILKNGNEDLTDDDIEDFFANNYLPIIKTVELMGEEAFIYSFKNKMDALSNMIERFQEIGSSIGDGLYEAIIQKTNVEQSGTYKKLKSKIIDNKKNLETIKSPEYKNFETQTATKIKDLAAKISEIKQTTKDKAEINKLDKEIKQLRFDLKQNKTPEIITLENKINAYVQKLRKMQENSVKDPQDKIKLLNVVYAFTHLSGYDDIPQVLAMSPADTKEKQQKLAKFLEQKVFEVTESTYDENTARKLNLTKSNYLAEIFASDEDFKENFRDMIDILNDNPDETIAVAFNELPQNLETRRQFQKLGINYDRWVNVDKNSFVKVKVHTDIEKAKSATILNFEKDFNDGTFDKILQEHTKPILAALSNAGITLCKSKEAVYDADGILKGIKESSKFFKDNKPLEYDDLPEAIKIIRTEINKNEFWTKSNENSDNDSAASTFYNHILKLRANEIKNISKMRKDNEETILEVHQTNMNDISHALFLGNHAHCCTAVGNGCNQWSAPAYITNKLVSGIEVMDGKEFVGNTMCFIADIDGVTSLYLDNIELSSKYQYNDKIRDAIFDYAKKLCAEIGKPDMPIYAGPFRHKVNMPADTISSHVVKILGSTGEDEIYVDFLTDGLCIHGNNSSNVKLYRIHV